MLCLLWSCWAWPVPGRADMRCCLSAGLHPLAPYLVQLIATEIGSSLQRLPHLSLLLRRVALTALLHPAATRPHVLVDSCLPGQRC